MGQIPFNRPHLSGKEMEYIACAVANWQISGDGPFTKKCSQLLEKELGANKVLLTTNCTHALEMAGLLLDLKPFDEVIVPSFTFVSTVNAFALRGVRPVFCDVRRDTLNMDETILESLVTSRTRAIIPVHYAGVGCEMDTILRVAQKHGIPVIEDNAHGLFAKYKGKYLGTLGCIGTQSFHETKNFSCGEGGALILNDSSFVERAEIIREKGTNRSRFFRGEVDKYTWVELGSSFLPSDLLAAYLFAQLEDRDRIQSRRKAIWNYYFEQFSAWSRTRGVTIPHVPAECEQSYHMFYMVLPSLEARQRLIAWLKARDIHGIFHYLPLHLSEMGRKYGGRAGDCPVTEHVCDRLLRMPFFTDLTIDEQQRVVEAVQAFDQF